MFFESDPVWVFWAGAAMASAFALIVLGVVVFGATCLADVTAWGRELFEDDDPSDEILRQVQSVTPERERRVLEAVARIANRERH